MTTAALERVEAPPRASDRRVHSRPRGPCRSAPLLHLLSALFPDRGPGHLRVGQSPAGPWDRGPLCTESLFVPRPAPGQVSRSHTFRFSHVLTESRPPVQGAAARTLSPRSQKARTPRPRGAAAAGGHRLCRVRSWAAARQPSGKTRLEARTLLDLDVKATKAGHLENKADVNFQAEWVASGSPALPRLWKGGQRSTWKAKPPPLTHTVLSSTRP